ncbi:hypothetical protein NL364_27820, partial [Klebsiella pneumoniae]|nr:hypothetical protein [Klebsiella pneumoniae]
AFAALPPDALGDLRLALHPAVALIRSVHPIADIMAAATGAAAGVEDWTPQALLVDRPGFDVVTRPIACGTATFLAALGAGHPLGAAAAAADD